VSHRVDDHDLPDGERLDRACDRAQQLDGIRRLGGSELGLLDALEGDARKRAIEACGADNVGTRDDADSSIKRRSRRRSSRA
jgi:hypothetical protein